MSNLRIAALQVDLIWEDKQSNLAKIESLLEPISGMDIVVLPEMFSTGFSMNPADLSEDMDGPTLRWMKSCAASTGSAITGSIIIEEEGRYYNRMMWVQPDGHVEHYDKRHLFAYAGEDEVYTAGKDRKVVDYKGWRICLQVCYDLRFPVFSRYQGDYDLLLYPANWPERRSYPWKQLLIARAIENMSYVIGVNRVGVDGNDIFHSGDSRVIDPLGEVIAKTKGGEEEVLVVELTYSDLEQTRNRFRFLDDRDDFELIND